MYVAFYTLIYTNLDFFSSTFMYIVVYVYLSLSRFVVLVFISMSLSIFLKFVLRTVCKYIESNLKSESNSLYVYTCLVSKADCDCDLFIIKTVKKVLNSLVISGEHYIRCCTGLHYTIRH